MSKKNQREIVKEGLPLIGAVTTGDRWEKGIFSGAVPRSGDLKKCYFYGQDDCSEQILSGLFPSGKAVRR